MVESTIPISACVGGHVISLTEAGPTDMTTMENLMTLYLYDFSEYTGDDPDELGRFAEEHLPLCWTEHGRTVEGRVPYLVRVDGKLAGFVLVKKPHSQAFHTDHDIGEFFIMRKWRRLGIGSAVAHAVFARYPGVWEVRVMRESAPALAFWRRTINEYAGGRYQEIDSRSEHWDGIVFVFRSESPA